MNNIYHLPTSGGAESGVDYDTVQALRSSVGEARYAEIAERATFALAERLGRLERAYRHADMDSCYRYAVNICGIASQIGLNGVVSIAQDVMHCVRRRDPALPAVLERLNRTAEESLFDVLPAAP